jgi:predicted RNA binding protein YcfA (HicA-like mRNA interferase family)
LKSTDLIEQLEAAGWRLDGVRGSLPVFKHPDKPSHITVPHRKKDLGTGLAASIKKAAGI